LCSNGFEGADYRSADGYNATTFACGGVDGGDCVVSEGLALAVEADVFKAVDAERGKRAEADVEREAGDLNSLRGECVQYCGSEVEACGGRGDRALLLREDGLIALAIFNAIVATDVGRQGHVTDAVEDVEEVFGWSELKEALAELAALEDFSIEEDFAGGGGKNEALADGYFFAGADQGAPAVCCERRVEFLVSHPCARRKAQGWGTGRLWSSRFGEEDFNATGGLFTIADDGAVCVEAGGDDSGVVED
jgi:hypothetical protein